jgi:glutamate dehydrogenase
MLNEINRAAELGTLWFLRHGRQPLDIAEHIEAFRPGIATLVATPDLVPERERAGIADRVAAHVDDGVPEDLASHIAVLPLLAPSLDIVRIASAVSLAPEQVARLYFAVGERFGLDWLRKAAAGVSAESHWDRMATAAIVDDLYGHQAEFARHILTASPASANGLDPEHAIEAWTQGRGVALQRTEALFADLRQTGGIDLAKLAVANRELRGLVGA